jgi:hypothetical protein
MSHRVPQGDTEAGVSAIAQLSGRRLLRERFVNETTNCWSGDPIEPLSFVDTTRTGGLFGTAIPRSSTYEVEDAGLVGLVHVHGPSGDGRSSTRPDRCCVTHAEFRRTDEPSRRELRL